MSGGELRSDSDGTRTDSAAVGDLPFVDEHRINVAAEPPTAWRALVAVAAGSMSGPMAERYARLVRCEPAVPSGNPTAVGSAIAGFRVAESVPGERYLLTGHHHFSNYAFDFRVEPLGDGSVIRASTYAEFLGRLGRLYRAAVIGSRGHVLVTNRMLRAMRDRAER